MPRAITSSKAAGIRGLTALGCGGGEDRCAAMTRSMDPTLNGGGPVIAS
jgi:hypothetical protein